MSVIRVNKTKDYSVMSNYHLKDKKISLKAKGLLSMMLSLPDNWNYTIEGLAAINKEGTKSVRSALQELEEKGYLIRTQERKPNGEFSYIYDVYEIPNRYSREGYAVEGNADNGTQYNINNKNTDKKYICHGTYKRVKLTEDEYNRLIEEYDKEFIDAFILKLDEYVESNNNKNKYSNFNLVLRKAIREHWFDVDGYCYDSYYHKYEKDQMFGGFKQL